MATKLSDHDYVNEISKLAPTETAPRWVSKASSRPVAAYPKVFYKSLNGVHNVNSAQELVTQSSEDEKTATAAICIIENITPEYVQVIGSAWKLDHQFFVGHSVNPPRQDLWKQNPPFTIDPPATDTLNLPYAHLNGVFEYHGWEKQAGLDLNSSPNYFARHCFADTMYGIQSNTRISYYSVREGFYLILVDAPLILTGCKKTKPRSQTTLRLLYAVNYGGVLIPQLFSNPNYSLFENFKSMFHHNWLWTWLVGPYCTERDPPLRLVPPHVLLYYFCSSLWETNFRWLDAEVKRISFEEIREPSLRINDILHDHRGSLAQLKSAVMETITYVDENLEAHFEQQKKGRRAMHEPIGHLKRLRADAEHLEKFLMDTFQLLMSSISVHDSKLSMDQGRRGAWLTQLAFIYVPLSFVTGVYGMNLREINDSPLPATVCVVTMVVVVFCTVVVFSVIKFYERIRRGREGEDGLDRV